MPLPPRAELPGHRVENQPPPRGDADLWAQDPALATHLGAHGGDPAIVAAQARLLGADRASEGLPLPSNAAPTEATRSGR